MIPPRKRTVSSPEEQQAVCERLIQFWCENGHPEVTARPILRERRLRGDKAPMKCWEVLSNVQPSWVPKAKPWKASEHSDSNSPGAVA